MEGLPVYCSLSISAELITSFVLKLYALTKNYWQDDRNTNKMNQFVFFIFR